MKNKKVQRKFRHQRVRKKITGTSKRPRLAVFRSNKHIYAQLIDDATFRTITSSSDSNLSSSEKSLGKMDRIKTAFEVGMNLAKSATKKKVKKVVFDRGGYKFHGRVKALAQGAQQGGLIF